MWLSTCFLDTAATLDLHLLTTDAQRRERMLVPGPENHSPRTLVLTRGSRSQLEYSGSVMAALTVHRDLATQRVRALVGWLGDCRVVLSEHEGQARALTQVGMHTPQGPFPPSLSFVSLFRPPLAFLVSTLS